MNTTRNVLVIAYYFPPMGLSGVQRTLKFVKYLPQFGWKPTVITVTPTGYFAQDETLLRELADTEIVRVGSLDPNRLFRKKRVVRMPSERSRKILTFLSDTLFIPDNKIGWKHQVLKAAGELFKKKKFDIIFATAPPFTDFLIGAELAARFHKPLVLDYRDVWHEYPYKYYPTPLHKWANFRLERKALHTASRIITTNRRVKELILKRYKFLDYNDVTILPQGFDPNDFVMDGEASRSNRMVFTHAGVFYGDRTPVYFLRALKQLFEKQPALKGRIEARFVGNFQDEQMELVKTMGLHDNVTVTGYLDHARCIRELRSSDVLWFMLNNDRQSPGKLYEYLGARKPILACVPEGFVRQTLQEAEAGFIVPPSDVNAIASGILRLYELFEQQKLPRPREEVVEKYDRIELTRELSHIFGFLTE